MLKVEDATYIYNQNRVLMQEFNYEFKAGERYFISGANGSGKSTFMRILAGEQRLTNGKIIDVAKSKVYIPQQFKLPENFICTCRELLNNLLELLKRRQLLTSSMLHSTYHELLSDLNFANLLDRNISSLSVGEQQKLVLLRALLSQADLYLFDEAWSALDEATINKLPLIFTKYLPKQACLLQISHGHAGLWVNYQQVKFPLVSEVQYD